MTRKNKSNSKNSGNMSFLALKKRKQEESSNIKHISNYYKKCSGVIHPADNMLITILEQQIEHYGIISAIQVLKHELEESSDPTLMRFYQISKKWFEKPDENDVKMKDNIYSWLSDGAGIPEIPVEILLDASFQDTTWYSQVDRIIPVTITSILQNDKTELLIPRALESAEYDLLYKLVQPQLKDSFKDVAEGSRNGSTNADLWMADCQTVQEVSPPGGQWSYHNELPLLTKYIDIDPDRGMTDSQIKFVIEGNDQSVLKEVKGKYQHLDLSFIIPMGQNYIVEGSEKYIALQKYLVTIGHVLTHSSLTHTKRSEAAEEEETEYIVKVKDIELLVLLVLSGITQPWKDELAGTTSVPEKVKKPLSNQVAANLKMVQKQDEGKEKYMDVLDDCIRHLKRHGEIMEVVPSTTMTHINGVDVYGLARDQIIRAGKFLGTKALLCLIRYFSGQIFIWDIWSRIMGKLLIHGNPELQGMALKFFDGMFTEEGIKRLSETYSANSLLTRVVFGHAYGTLAMALMWELAGEKEETVSKISLVNQIHHETLLDTVTQGSKEAHFFRRDFDSWMLDVGDLIKASGSVIDVTDVVKTIYGFHPLATSQDVEEYPMKNWENLLGEVYLENEDYEALNSDIKENEVWAPLRGRTHVALESISRVLRRRNKEVAITEELAESIMNVFVDVFKLKQKEWNASPNDGYTIDKKKKPDVDEIDKRDDEQGLSVESALSVVVRANDQEVTAKLNDFKIYQLQKKVDGNLCSAYSLTNQCKHGDNCKLNHVKELNIEDGIALTNGIRKIVGKEGVNITYKHKTPANDKLTAFNTRNPGARKSYMKKMKKDNAKKIAGPEVKAETEPEEKRTWASEITNTGKGGRGQSFGKGKGRGGDAGKGGRGRGYKGYPSQGDYENQREQRSASENYQGKGGKGGSNTGYSDRQPNTNRGKRWNTGDLSIDGHTVYLGNNKAGQMSFIPRHAYETLENSIYLFLNNIFNDMVSFESVSGFSQFFEKCNHGCQFHTLHARKCLCAFQNQGNCGVSPCVVNVFLPRMSNREKVGLNNLSRNINFNSGNYENQKQERGQHCPWRAHMSRRQIQNDKILNEGAMILRPGTNDDDKTLKFNSQGALIVNKSFDELMKEEEETIKRLNLLKAEKAKMKMVTQTKPASNTRYMRVQQE